MIRLFKVLIIFQMRVPKVYTSYETQTLAERLSTSLPAESGSTPVLPRSKRRTPRPTTIGPCRSAGPTFSTPDSSWSWRNRYACSRCADYNFSCIGMSYHQIELFVFSVSFIEGLDTTMIWYFLGSTQNFLRTRNN